MRIKIIGNMYFVSVIVNKQIIIGKGLSQEEAIVDFQRNFTGKEVL